MKIVGIIPARYASTRFPGKPLIDICGKPMIWWVYQKAIKALDNVYIATENTKISEVCSEFGIPFIMTSENCETCTDRVAEAARLIDADIYASILGDEPCICIDDIKIAINITLANINVDASTVCLPINDVIDVINTTTQKFVLNDQNDVIYISRQPIPYPQQSTNYNIYKHVGIYIFRKKALEFFAQTPMGRIETIEGNDLMRFIENRKHVKAHITKNKSLSVDTPKDLEKVIAILKEQEI